MIGEAFWLLLAVGLVFGPLVMASIAWSRTRRAERELERLNHRLDRLEALGRPAARAVSGAPVPAAAPAAAPVSPPPPVASLPVAPPPVPIAVPVSRPLAVPRPIPPVARPAPSSDMEWAIGGKASSFIGIAALVIGVAFFVGYAIQHNWIGPVMRVSLGLLAGAVLVGLGYAAEVRSDQFSILSRALTGGGGALFYFSVFAAHGVYKLIGPGMATVGLVGSAAAVFALALVYKSQAVALVGVIGAFITPHLLSADLDRGLFPLGYIALINVPILALGRRRNWQVLFNTAFVLTAAHMSLWLSREVPDHWDWALAGVAVYYAQFTLLAWLRCDQERSPSEGRGDAVRAAIAGALLLGALHFILTTSQLEWYRGTAYLVAALAHVGLLRAAFAKRAAWPYEVTAWALVALTFAAVALPAQLDGVWVSLGWGIEGVLLAWFALRLSSPFLQGLAFAVALLGLGKSVFYDSTLYTKRPTLFLNGRFAVGMLSSALLFVQARFHAREDRRTGNGGALEANALSVVALLAMVLASVADVFLTCDMNAPRPWILSSLVLLAVGASALIVFPANSAPRLVGGGLLLLVPWKIALIDLSASWHVYQVSRAPFLNAPWLMYVGLIVLSAAFVGRYLVSANLSSTAGVGRFHTLAAVAALLIVVTSELYRIDSSWKDSAVTVVWAFAALSLALTGLVRHAAHLRYAGLTVFGITLFKVFLVDLAELRGLERAAAFAGVGVLLLLLSMAYQRVAPKLLARKDPEGEAP